MQEVSGSSPLSSTGQKHNSNRPNRQYSSKVSNGGPMERRTCVRIKLVPFYGLLAGLCVAAVLWVASWAKSRSREPVTLAASLRPGCCGRLCLRRLLPRFAGGRRAAVPSIQRSTPGTPRWSRSVRVRVSRPWARRVAPDGAREPVRCAALRCAAQWRSMAQSPGAQRRHGRAPARWPDHPVAASWPHPRITSSSSRRASRLRRCARCPRHLRHTVNETAGGSCVGRTRSCRIPAVIATAALQTSLRA